MLTELDHKLIAAEIAAENGTLKPVDFSIERILRKYHAYQITCHWYDSMPPECDQCNSDDCDRSTAHIACHKKEHVKEKQE